MDRTRIAELTDGQKAALRLYYRRLTAKEIARLLEISSHTVHQRLKSARTLLSASASMEAARLLAEVENEGLYDRVVYDPIGLDRTATFDAVWLRARSWWPWRTARKPTNDLTSLGRIIVIFMLAAGTVALVAILSLAAAALDRQL